MGVYPLTNLFDIHTSYAVIELRVIVSSLSVRKQRIHLSDILHSIIIIEIYLSLNNQNKIQLLYELQIVSRLLRKYISKTTTV